MVINPGSIPQRTTSNYPEQFQPRVAGRIKQALGKATGIKNFGINLVQLLPRSSSSLRHWHSKQDEFIYVIEGEITLITDAGEQILTNGMMADLRAGETNGHHLINKSNRVAAYLEIGDRTPNDEAHYPDDDLVASASENGWIF